MQKFSAGEAGRSAGSVKLALSLALCISLLAAGCSPPRGTPPASPLESEARREAERFWFSQITRCGDSYYRERELINGVGSEFFEIKEPAVRVAPWRVTEADRMNGVEWHGLISLGAKASRKWGPTLRRWEAWADGLAGMSDNSYTMKKAGRRWEVDTSRGRIFDEAWRSVPPDCSEIPPP